MSLHPVGVRGSGCSRSEHWWGTLFWRDESWRSSLSLAKGLHRVHSTPWSTYPGVGVCSEVCPAQSSAGGEEPTALGNPLVWLEWVEIEGTRVFSPRPWRRQPFCSNSNSVQGRVTGPSRESLSNTGRGTPGEECFARSQKQWNDPDGGLGGISWKCRKSHFKYFPGPGKANVILLQFWSRENLLILLTSLPSLLPTPWARKEVWRRRKRKGYVSAPPTSRGGEKLKAVLQESPGGLGVVTLHSHGRGPGLIPGCRVNDQEKNGRKRASGYWLLQEAELFLAAPRSLWDLIELAMHWKHPNH